MDGLFLANATEHYSKAAVSRIYTEEILFRMKQCLLRLGGY